MSTASREAVKVVLIDTQYVKTDAASFKSVVQSLTGKDSSVAWIEESSFKGQKEGRSAAVDGAVGKSIGSADGAGGVSVLSKDLSYKDFDTLMTELPPLQDFNWLLSDN